MEIITPLIYLFSSSVLWIISKTREDWFQDHFENFSQNKLQIILSMFIFWLIAYGWIIVKNKIIKFKPIYLLAILIIALTFPWLSRDTGSYVVSARNLYVFHLNPYRSIIGSEINPWSINLKNIWWANYPSPYGPVFWLFTWPIIFSQNIIGAVWIYKTLTLLAFVVSIYFFKKILEQNKIEKSVLWLYILNPAILLQVVGESHNEIFIMMFMFMAVYFLKNNYWKKGLFFLIISIFIKYYTLVLMPILWVNKKGIQIIKLLISLIVLIIITLGTLYLFKIDINNLINTTFSFVGNFCIYSCTPLVIITNWLPPNLRSIIRIILFILTSLLVGYGYLWKNFDILRYIFWILIVLFFVYTTWLTPWYLILIIPFGLLIGGKYKYYSLGLTVYSLLHYFGI